MGDIITYCGELSLTGLLVQTPVCYSLKDCNLYISHHCIYYLRIFERKQLSVFIIYCLFIGVT